ncbi:hypothetical protein [Roseomonas populi]|uniref:Uncharacterized protein n=1 Tax=Roseomonas populi TaxID=3121582 RepID=A0ABT1WYY4_9PROT|nr:hypothetical protein [Roseomonas pecuniae]MCR0980746.1 hypothetical protein [Roseomonas pecuniae]
MARLMMSDQRFKSELATVVGVLGCLGEYAGDRGDLQAANVLISAAEILETVLARAAAPQVSSAAPLQAVIAGLEAVGRVPA